MNKVINISRIQLALLAFIIASMSSFGIRSSQNYFANRWETFGVAPNTASGAPFPSSAQQLYSAKISDGFLAQATSYLQALIMNLLDVDSYAESYNIIHFPSSVMCDPNSQYICIATVSYYNQMPNGATLVDYSYGDYSLTNNW